MTGKKGMEWGVTLPCGTPAAYRRHLRKRTRPCARCLLANSLDTQRSKRRRRGEKVPTDPILVTKGDVVGGARDFAHDEHWVSPPLCELCGRPIDADHPIFQCRSSEVG